MEDQVKVELEIIRSELQKVGIQVPLDVMAKWSVAERAAVEQWAIHKRWSTMKKPPCPPEHQIHPKALVRPRILHRWVVN